MSEQDKQQEWTVNERGALVIHGVEFYIGLTSTNQEIADACNSRARGKRAFWETRLDYQLIKQLREQLAAERDKYEQALLDSHRLREDAEKQLTVERAKVQDLEQVWNALDENKQLREQLAEAVEALKLVREQCVDPCLIIDVPSIDAALEAVESQTKQVAKIGGGK